MDFPISLDVEHSKIFEQLPMILLLGFFAIMAVPIIPAEIKGPVVLVGLGGIFVLMVAVGPVAQFVASQYIPIKVRIRPWNIEKTFYCKKPAGMIDSKPDERGIYTTRFELGIKTTLPKVGVIDGLELEHKRPFDERNLGSEVYVMFMGNEVTHSRVILAEFWVPDPDEPFTHIDHQKKIARFEMAVGGEDWWLTKKNRDRGFIGPFDINVGDFANGK